MERDVFKQDAVIGAPPQLPRDDPLAGELLCASCNYDLRGLDIGGNCPECGRPIASSINPPEALGGDLRWTRRAARSLRAFARGFGMCLVVLPIASLVALGSVRFDRIASIALLLDLLTFVALWGNMLWALTARHRALDFGQAEPEPRRVARTTFAVSCALGAVAVLVSRAGWGSWWIWAALALVLPVGITGPVGAWGWSSRLRQIAELAGDEAAARTIRGDFRVFAGGYVATGVLLLMTIIFGPLPLVLAPFTLVIAVLSLVFLLLAPLRLWISADGPLSSYAAPSTKN